MFPWDIQIDMSIMKSPPSTWNSERNLSVSEIQLCWIQDSWLTVLGRGDILNMLSHHNLASIVLVEKSATNLIGIPL